MESVRYKHLTNFLHQRGQKIPGIPFLSLWQFASAIGFGFAGYALQLPVSGILFLGLAALIAFHVYHGEFVGRRLLAMTIVYGLALVSQWRVVNFEVEWESLAKKDEPIPSLMTITLEGEAGAMVLS